MELLATGLVYRNPKPYLRAVHAWHPSILQLDSGELVASFDCGQGAEALDYRTYLSRSTDDGRTWTSPAALFDDPTQGRTTQSIRIGRLSDGTLIGVGGRWRRDNPEEGIVNRANLGYVPQELLQLQSNDGGRTWSVPRVIEPPLLGPGFEVCHSVIDLPDGRWLYPTATWKSWDGDAPNGMQAVAFVSHDRGRTWPEYLRVMDRYEDGIISWEQSLVRLHDGRLLAVAWAFDERSGTSLPNPYAVSADGRTFGPPRMTGLVGETAKLLTLRDGRLLCLYRRKDQPGLWAALVQISGDEWQTLEQMPVWQGAASGMTGRDNSSNELSDLRFGYPTLVQRPDGAVFALFWCQEDCINNIRWVKLRVE
jgi:sialidase-1